MGYASDEGYSLEEEAIAHLYIIVTRSFKLLGWIETELSLSSSSLNEENLSPHVVLKVLSCNVFIFLLYILLCNITQE